MSLRRASGAGAIGPPRRAILWACSTVFCGAACGFALAPADSATTASGESFPPAREIPAGPTPAGTADRVSPDPAREDASTPSDSAPSDSAPSDSAPSDSAPSDSAPSDSAPSDSAPSDEAAKTPIHRQPDVVYWATPAVVVDKMLELARLAPGELVYDLGCGDARSLVTAAERYQARGVGFDIDLRRVQEARRNVRQHQVEHLVRIERADILTVDVSPADVIFLYMLSRINERLVPQFEKMRPGSRIVAHDYGIPSAQPLKTVQVLGPPDGPPETDGRGRLALHKIFLWRLPLQRRTPRWVDE